MKSKTHGSMKDEIKANLNRLMAAAGFNRKTLSEAAELNRGYVGSVLRDGETGRSVGPEALIALSGAIGRVLNRDSRIVTLQILGFNTDDLLGGGKLENSPLENIIEGAVKSAEAGELGKAEPAPAPAEVVKVSAAKPNPKGKAKAAPKSKAEPKKPEPAKLPEGVKAFTWIGTVNGHATRLLCATENLTRLCKIAGIGKSTAYGKVQEAKDPAIIAVCAAKPGVLLMGRMAKGGGEPKPEDYKDAAKMV